MEIVINKAILHVLDTNINTPVLSTALMELNDISREFLMSHISKTFNSDDCKSCEFQIDSTFQQLLAAQMNFIDSSKQIAIDFFNIMMRNPSIPPSDLIVCDAKISGTDYIVILKMNYKEAYIHYYSQQADEHRISIIKQRTVLPPITGKLDEAIFITKNDFKLKLIEKKYDIDGIKDYYLSTLILNCSQNLPERIKFKAVKKATENALKKYYDNNMIEPEITSIICQGTSENTISIREIKEKIEHNYPLSQKNFIDEITATNLNIEDKIILSSSNIKKLAKQSIHTENGVEVKIPLDIINSNNLIEFINNPDGSISLLIKNIIFK